MQPSKKVLTLVLGLAGVVAVALTLALLRLPPSSTREASGPASSLREASIPSDPTAKSVPDIVAAYRKIIVLLEGEASLDPADRARVSVVGKIIFQENQERLGALGERLERDTEAALNANAAALPGSVATVLDQLETSPELHDADKLVFRETLEGLAALLRETKASSPLKSQLQARIADDLKALREIQALYEKELEQIFSRFETRGMTVRREAWDKYVAFLKTKFTRTAILTEYEKVTAPLGNARGRAERQADTSRELFGTGLPPKTLVLTFDDGPHPRYTDRVLEILKRFNVPAVFFQVGRNIATLQQNESIKLTRAAAASQRVLEAGLPLANHTYSHALLPKLGEREVAQEIEATNRVLEGLTKAKTALFRPPYGARSTQVLSILQAQNLKSVMWNVDSQDWADPIPRSIANRVLQVVEHEGRGILLFHDIHARTIEALPVVLETLQADGYRFATWSNGEFVVKRSGTSGTEPVPVAKPPAAPPYRESWAVIIGIDDYAKWPKLRYAGNDARGARDILIRKYRFKPENVFTLLDQEATRPNILSLLGDKLGNPDLVKRGDRVFVFFAGHGITRRLSSGRDLGYIVPVEADTTNYQGQSISMTNFQDIAEGIPAKHVLFVMDSCYSGLGLTRGGRVPQTQNYLKEIARRTARQMLTAGGADQQVADNGPNGHSVFTWTLLQALEGGGDLNGDGFITASELAAYTAPIVSSLSQQTPAFGNLPGSEGGEFVFELQPETEYLSALSTQLDEEAIRLNSEIERLRAEIHEKSLRNKNLQKELAAAQATLKQLGLPAGQARPKPKAETASAHNDRGMALFKEKNYAKALEQFLEATRLDPSSALAANNVGFTHYKLEQYEEAARWFERAIALDPRRAIAYLNLGDAYAKLNRRPDAKRAFEKYLELQPSSRSSAYAQDMIKSLE